MDYFKSLIGQSISRSREATLSMLGINNTGLRTHIGHQMTDELGAEGCFLAPPVFEHTFGWQQGEPTFQDLSNSLFSEQLITTLVKAPAYDFSPEIRPYAHQLQAWQALMEPEPKSVVITSGTGSGKTECFMIPILEDLIKERQQTQKALVGVRALFLYPLNALINSQQERLDAWTTGFGADLRFCLYNGKTEQSESKVRKLQQLHRNQVLSRELLRKEPAPILMTNSTMLEYMLVRQEDNPILEISCQQQSLRWIVLDEAHTYIGSQAAELSLLLRRVVQAFGRKSSDIRFVATSATIADNDATERLQDYLAALAGVDRQQVVVIGGSRVVPDLQGAVGGSSKSLEQLLAIDNGEEVSGERYAALTKSDIASTVRHHVVTATGPVDLNDLIITAGPFLSAEGCVARQRELLAWIDLMTGTKGGAKGAPFLKLRVHLFQRMMHGLWGCVDPGCSAKTKELKEWPFGNVYVSQRARCECNAPVYEIGFCQECKEPHLLAEDRAGQLQQRSAYVGDEFSLNYEMSDSDTEALNAEITSTASSGIVNRIVLAAPSTGCGGYTSCSLDRDNARFGSLVAETTIEVKYAVDSTAGCSNCDHTYPDSRDFLRKSYLGAPFYVSNAVPTVLEYCPDPDKEDCKGKSPEELPGRGRKLITFTDSRQGTARMAVRMQQEAERSRLRGLVFDVLRNEQAKADSVPKDVPTGSYEDLLEQAEGLKKMGMAKMADDVIAEAEALKTGVTAVTSVEVSWSDMAEALASSKDISQSILDYNRYANPELFSGHEAGATMARLLMAREYSRRPKNQNSTETLAIVKINYARLGSITEVPKYWTETTVETKESDGKETFGKLNLGDWLDFLKVALDFHVRENTFINLDPTMQRWMGSRFPSKRLFAPGSDIVESSTIKRWPEIKKGTPSRLVRLLELGAGLDRKQEQDRDKISFWLKSAWEALVSKHILEPFDHGYALNLASLTFSLPTEARVCPVTNRLLDTTFRGLTPYLPRKINKQKIHCKQVSMPDFTMFMPKAGGSGSAVEQIRGEVLNNEDVLKLRGENLWTDIADRTVEGGFYYRTAEHSAQQSSEKLEAYEQMFKDGKVNVLNCSTTMEMGVDIGGISAVVMNNVPPHPANYLQRAGRAGRRSESRAIAYTLCKADPHNQRAFNEPKWPFVTAIPAPSITLSSDRIVLRHVNSQMLAMFLRNETPDNGDRLKLTVKWFFFGGDESPYTRFVDWITSYPEEVGISISDLVRGTGLSGRSLASIVDDSIEVLSPMAERWNYEYKQLTNKMAAAKDEPYKKALSFELKRHEDEYLLRDLAARAFLPGYGFPTDVVNLSTYNVEDFLHQSKQKLTTSREDNIFTSKEQPTRGLNIAIREYAPGAQVVIDGRVYRSAGVGLHWHSGGAVKEAQKFDISWRCDHCGASGYKENAYSNTDGLSCTHCGHEVPFSERKMVLRPAGFLTDFYEPTSNDISSQNFISIERPRIQLEGESISLPDQRCGHIRFGHKGSVFYHSSGENEQGYAICMACGRAESMLHDGTVPKGLLPDKSHRPVGGSVGSHKEKDCSGSHVMSKVFLGYQTHTDVLELFLRNPVTGQWLTDSNEDQVIATTIAVALRDVISDELGIASTEMGFGFRLDRDIDSGNARSAIQLFDQVSGGAGFVLAGVGEINRLLQRVQDKLECKAQCENVCSCCLAGQDSRVELEELDRRATLAWLTDSRFFSHLSLPEAFKIIPDATYCSYGPKRYIRTAINRGADTISLMLGGDPEQWDLGCPVFRESVLTWLVVDKLSLNLCIQQGVQLPEEIKQSLILLQRLGVNIVSIEGSMVGDIAVVSQLSSNGVTQTLFTDFTVSASPGDNWLLSEDSSVWVSTQSLAAIDVTPLDTTGWEGSDSGAQLIEIRNELNGSVSSLDQRLKSIFKDESPELYDLIEADTAVSVSYTDRYLNSPWTLILLEGFLSLFKGGIDSLAVHGVASRNPKEGTLLQHDWKEVSDQKSAIESWLENSIGIKPSVTLASRSYEISHGRMISIDWASGKRTRIFLDQGMGYWRARMPYRDEMEFDFYQALDGQISDMRDKSNKALMVNSGSWPTFITVLNE